MVQGLTSIDMILRTTISCIQVLKEKEDQSLRTEKRKENKTDKMFQEGKLSQLSY